MTAEFSYSVTILMKKHLLEAKKRDICLFTKITATTWSNDKIIPVSIASSKAIW